MKRKILALALAAALLLPLVGCGEDTDPGNDDTNKPGTNSDVTTPGTDGDTTTPGTNDDITTPGTGTDMTDDDAGSNGVTDGDTTRSRMGSGDTVFTDNNGSTFGGSGRQMQNERMPGTVYDGTQWPAQQTATWDQMLDNGFVHDRDGFLLDGENASW